DDPVLVWKAATADMHPRVDRTEIARAYAEDPIAARAEYGAQFREDVDAYVTEEVVEANVVPGRTDPLPPWREYRYVAFVDPSGGMNDSFAVAVAHKEVGSDGLERIEIDMLLETRAPYDPLVVTKLYCGALQAYGITRVLGDGYAGAWPRAMFKTHGIQY